MLPQGREKALLGLYAATPGKRECAATSRPTPAGARACLQEGYLLVLILCAVQSCRVERTALSSMLGPHLQRGKVYIQIKGCPHSWDDKRHALASKTPMPVPTHARPCPVPTQCLKGSPYHNPPVSRTISQPPTPSPPPRALARIQSTGGPGQL